MKNPTMLNIREVIRRTALSRSTIYEWESKGKFPVSIKLGLRAKRWVESDISDWLNRHIEGSRRSGGQADD
ncbi:MAG: AlpA family phage regulatory protein [Candidatus Thiodiazotropha sp.]|nr:AlpA family phage regulatory protein [Candidatus Thiodiazotropha sp.]